MLPLRPMICLRQGARCAWFRAGRGKAGARLLLPRGAVMDRNGSQTVRRISRYDLNATARQALSEPAQGSAPRHESSVHPSPHGSR